MTTLSLPRQRPWPGIRATALATAGTIVTGVLLACGLRIALAATVSPRYLVPSGRRTGYPMWMRGPLHGHSGPMPLHTFLLLMGVMTLAWALLLVLVRGLPGWFVAGSVLVATLIFTLAPPLLSTDVFNYIAYGFMQRDGINPYQHGPIVLLGQPVYEATGHLWRDVPSAYGPLFTLLTFVLAPLGLVTSFWVLKAVTAIALLVTAAFVWATAKHLGRDPRLAVVFVVLNPLVLVYALGGAHNDLVMAAPLAAAAYLVVKGRPAGEGAAVMGAVAIKASAGLALPFVVLGARPRWRALVGAAAAGVALAAVALAVYGTSITKMITSLSADQHFNWVVVSVPHFIGYYTGLGTPSTPMKHALVAAGAGLIVVMLVRARGGRGWIEGAAATALVVLATTAWVLPWYIVWALPFVALVRGRAIPVAAVVVTVLLMAMQLDHFVVTHASHHLRTHASALHRRRA